MCAAGQRKPASSSASVAIALAPWARRLLRAGYGRNKVSGPLTPTVHNSHTVPNSTAKEVEWYQITPERGTIGNRIAVSALLLVKASPWHCRDPLIAFISPLVAMALLPAIAIQAYNESTSAARIPKSRVRR